jgi:hypothetical protein
MTNVRFQAVRRHLFPARIRNQLGRSSNAFLPFGSGGLLGTRQFRSLSGWSLGFASRALCDTPTKSTA